MSKKNSKIQNYQVSDFLGKGSFGEVYKGKNQNDGTEVAIKYMDLTEINKSKFLRGQLDLEINLMKSINHPNVLKLYETIETKTHHILILEYCKDGDMEKYLEKNNGSLEEGQAIVILQQLMEGFKELIKHNFIHRDIKPSNFLNHNNVFKIADFGFVAQIETGKKNLLRDYVGTPLYAAPQILEEKSYTAKCDIWSIGMTFYQMLFGRSPWSDRDTKSLLKDIQSNPLKFPVHKPVSVESKQFLKDCLVYSEENRIGWDQIFQHPIFDQKSSLTASQISIELQKIMREVLSKLQKVVIDENVNPQVLFNKYDTNKNNTLSKKEFFAMVSKIQASLSERDSNSIYELLVQSKNREIDFEMFQQIIYEYDYSGLNNMTEKLVNDLKKAITNYNISIFETFKNFDLDHTQNLDRDEFRKMTLTMFPGLREIEIKKLFEYIDTNKDQSISKEEFLNAFTEREAGQCHINKSVLLRDAQNILKELKEQIKQNRVDLMSIYKKHSSQTDKSLDKQGFFEVLRTICFSITPEESAKLFKASDLNDSNTVTYGELFKLLN